MIHIAGTAREKEQIEIALFVFARFIVHVAVESKLKKVLPIGSVKFAEIPRQKRKKGEFCHGS